MGWVKEGAGAQGHCLTGTSEDHLLDRGWGILSEPLSKTAAAERADGNHAWKTKPCPAIPADNRDGSLWELVKAARGFHVGSFTLLQNTEVLQGEN